MPDYTPVALDTPIAVPKAARTLAGIRRHHRFAGFDFAESPRQIGETMDALGAVTGHVGGRVYDVFWNMLDAPEGDDPRDTVYTLWNEWIPTTVHAVAPDQPQFIYERGDKEDGPLDVWVPIITWA